MLLFLILCFNFGSKGLANICCSEYSVHCSAQPSELVLNDSHRVVKIEGRISFLHHKMTKVAFSDQSIIPCRCRIELPSCTVQSNSSVSYFIMWYNLFVRRMQTLGGIGLA